MTYEQCLDFLYRQLPMFQRDGSSAFKKDLTNTLALCEALQHPQEKFKSIHVAGTNGKGSVCHLLAAILQAEGFKVGLYTSPHYFDFRERIKINGQYISRAAVVGFVERIRNEIDAIEPSFFELTVAMAFDYFARKKVDIAVIETGLGGRLDSTNVIQPLISIITNISFDHQSLLGDSLPLIAAEKAGIIKSGIPVVIGERQEETESVFKEKALRVGAPIHFADERITIHKVAYQDDCLVMDVGVAGEGRLRNLTVGLTGGFQVKNMQTVLASLDVLCTSSGVCVAEESLRSGSHLVVRSTRMQGRWQRLRQNPTIIADSGHNVSGLGLAMQELNSMKRKQLRIVFGVSKDKDYEEMLQLLPKMARYYWCAADLPRSLSPQDLKKAAGNFDLMGNIYSSVAGAVKAALNDADPDDLIYVGGSSFVVGEVLELSL